MRPASVAQCAVLLDGTDTGEPATPLALHTCGDRPFLAWKLRELLRFGVDDFLLMSEDPSGAVAAALPAIRASLPKPARITCRSAPPRAGSGGALYHARARLAERFLLCHGASLLDFNLSRLLADAAGDPAEVTGRMVLRRLDEAPGCGVVETDGDRVTGLRGQPRPGERGTIAAGVCLLDRRILDDVAPACSLERDILPTLAARGALRGTVGDGYFVDIGIPADLERARAELPARLHRRALFLDRDGVINHDHGYVGTRDRFEWMAGARETIRAATDAGFHVFVVTNQSGIARGHYDEAQFAALNDWMVDQIRAAGGTVDDVRFCPFHPQASVEAYRRASDWRKPAPGMLLDLIARWDLDPARSLLIGDQPTDLAAAAAAGVAAHCFEGADLAAFARPLLARVN